MNGLSPSGAELSPDVSPRHAWLLAVLIAAAFFAAVAPTLNWLQFTNGNESIVVQTALEMRHGGEKLVPQMMGEPRVKKPPLVAWITAASMRPETIEAVNDFNTRDAAYADLAWQARWPTLLAACVLILATFEIGRLYGGSTVGLMSALVVCTNYLFLKYMRQSTSDAHLATWVTVANAAFAHGLLRGRWWVAAVVGSIATAMAFLCKGPVALAETVLPTIVMAGLLRRWAPSPGTPRAGWGEGLPSTSSDLRTSEDPLPNPPPEYRERGPNIAPLLVGIALFAAIAVPWFWHVWRTVPNVAATWKTEVGREGATDLEPSNPAIYLQLGFLTVPWIAFAAVGLGVIWQRRREPVAWLPMVLSIVPLLVMVWFRDRKERYMLPMIGPAAIICGLGVATWMRSWAARRTRGDLGVMAGHLFIVIGVGVALFVFGTVEKKLDGTPWFTRPLAAWGIVAVLTFAGLAIVVQRRRAWAVPAFTFVTMIGLLAGFTSGYRHTDHGLSAFKPMAEKILTDAPKAAVYDWLPSPNRVDEQLAIYLNHTVLRGDPATLVPLDRPIVVVMRQDRKQPVPSPGDAWLPLTSIKDRSVTWHAFVRYPSRGAN